ncbi:S1 family peptidase [Myceligenerans crystallogenes]|uniref:Peptidase S1 domain-containing protein n=1 Tax=Myceligenerans crystallogenes TaxID=316335 RepID=A0ABN2NHK2_9MICO
MNRRKLTVIGTAVTAGLALAGVLAGLSATALTPAGPAGGRPPADPAALSLAAERGISAQEAERRLGWQRSADAVARDVTASIGADRFGGLWIDPADDRLKVGVVAGAGTASSDLTRAVGRVAAGHDVAGAVDVVPVARPERELAAANRWIASRVEAASAGATGTLSTGYRPSRGTVLIGVPAEPSAAQRALVEAAGRKFGDLVETYRTEGEPVARACGFPYCDPPLRGGVRTWGGGGCTLGFIARSRADGKLYGLTAGHCVTKGTMYYTLFATDQSSHWIGPGHNRVFGGSGDAGIIDISNPTGWRPRAWVYVGESPARDGVGGTSRVTEYTITSDGSSREGMRVCKTGATAETTCGRVDAVDVTVDYTDGPVVNHLAQANLCSKSGDSGGPVFADHVAYGLVSGSRTGTCVSFYQGVRGAENLMNVDVAFAG